MPTKTVIKPDSVAMAKKKKLYYYNKPEKKASAVKKKKQETLVFPKAFMCNKCGALWFSRSSLKHPTCTKCKSHNTTVVRMK